jgi:hypothetical protein
VALLDKIVFRVVRPHCEVPVGSEEYGKRRKSGRERV